MAVFNAIFPVFAIIASGVCLAKFGFLTDLQFNGLSKLTYWIGLPCFLFIKIATVSPGHAGASKIFLIVLLAMFGSISIAYFICWTLRLKPASTAAFVQAAFRGNLSFIGLPVVVYSSTTEETEALAILALATIVPIYNVFSVLVLLGRKHFGLETGKRIVLQIITNPLLIGCALGLTFSFFSLELPLFLTRTLTAIGQMSLPLALFSIGGSLAITRVDNFKHATLAAIIKTIFTPLFGFWLMTLVPVSAQEAKLTLILLACPTAAISYVMAAQLKADKSIAAGAVLISAILGMVSLSLAML